MKTIKSMLAMIIFLAAGISAKAVDRPGAGRITRDEAVNVYVDAVAHGDLKKLDDVLDDSLHYNINRGGVVKTLGKEEVMDYLQSNPVDPSVNTVITPIVFDDNKAVVKVAFKYSNYTRTETITLNNEGGWMITNIDLSFS